MEAQYRAPNRRLINTDLMLPKMEPDANNQKYVFIFTIVGKLRLSFICCWYPHLFFSFFIGKYAAFCIFTCPTKNIYTMCEIAHIQLSLTIDHVPLFLSQLDRIVKAISCLQ